ncbi:MAG: hypothetical protein PHI35_00850 [Victivallaceae bacterium]|nr:hypothetical protein [Victivallaceae bacterium]
MKKFRAQSGQAMLELAVILIALAAMIVGVISVSSLVVNDNRRLLEAKYNAEKESRENSSASAVSGSSEIVTWSYSLYRYSSEKSLNIPFLGGDRRNSSSDNTFSSQRAGFHDSGDSSDSAMYNYFWQSPAAMRSDFDSDFSDNGGNALDAARLIRGDANGGDGGNDSNRVYMPVE